jgi:hypothetical protein
MCNPVQRSRAAFAYSRLSLRSLISRNAVRQPINTMPNTMSSEAFRITDANNATPTTPKMSSGKMGSRAVRAKDVMRMPATIWRLRVGRANRVSSRILPESMPIDPSAFVRRTLNGYHSHLMAGPRLHSQLTHRAASSK